MNLTNNDIEYSDYELIEGAKTAVKANMVGSGLWQRVVDKSEHGRGKTFESVDFVGYFTTSKAGGSIIIQPVLIESRQIGTQPVTPKLYRITEDPVEQQRLAETVWRNVDTDQRKAIVKSVAKQLRTSSLIYTGGPGYTKTLDSVDEVLSKGNLKINVDPQYASLKVII